MPRPHAAEVARSRLAMRIAARWDVPVTLVVAGAGFGKSTLLAQGVRANQLRPVGLDAWVGCERGDEDADRFGRRLLAALGAPAPTEVTLGHVLAAFASLAPAELSVMVDDVHLLGRHSGAARLLAEVVGALPPHAHLVLAGRAAPAVPLARLRAQGRLVELGERDLAFEPGEVDELAGRLGATRRGDALTEVVPDRRPGSPPGVPLGGWPALVRLALAGAPALDFVREEVTDALEAETLEAVAALATLGAADEEMVARVVGRPVRTADLVGRVPLIDVLGDGRLRAHDLWNGEVERGLDASTLAAVRGRAVEELAAAGDLAHAGAVASSLADWPRLADLAVDLVRRTVSVLPVDTARAWLLAVADGEAGRPGFVLLAAALRQRERALDASIDDVLDRLCDDAVAAGDPRVAIAAMAVATVAAHARADVGRLLALAGRAAGVPGAVDDAVLRLVSHAVRGVCHDLAGDPEAAVAEFAQARTADVPADLAVSVDRYHVHCLLMAGRADDAAALADATLGDVADAHAARIPALAHWWAGRPEPLLAAGAVPPTGSAGDREAFLEDAHRALVAASSGGELPDPAAIDPDRQANPRDVVLATLATAAGAVARHDEPAARDVIGRCLARYGTADRLAERHLRRALALGYVLDPDLRAHWATAPFGPTHARIRSLAARLVTAREEAVPADLDDADHDLAACSLPLPWSVELAAHLAAGRRAGGARLAARLATLFGPVVHDELRACVDAGGSLGAGAGRLLADVPRPPAVPVRLEVLGPLRVLHGGRPLAATELRRRRVRQLLALLALRPRIGRERVIDLLWPELGPVEGQRNLRVTLSHVRRVLEPGRPAGGSSFVLRTDGEQLQLMTSASLSCDLWDLEEALARADEAADAGHATARVGHLDEAVALVGPDPLADLGHVAEVEADVHHVTSRVVEAALTAGELHFAAGRTSRSAAHAERVLAADPYDERAHRLALASAVHAGDRRAASRASRRLAIALDELGVEPEPATAMAVRQADHVLGRSSPRAAEGMPRVA